MLWLLHNGMYTEDGFSRMSVFLNLAEFAQKGRHVFVTLEMGYLAEQKC